MVSKVVELNLEIGHPTVDAAIQKMKNGLTGYKRQGCKAVILIHGYGASGVGGSIKLAVRKSLAQESMRGIVKAVVGGEQWYENKRKFIDMCNSLDNYKQKIDGNEGVTVVLLK